MLGLRIGARWRHLRWYVLPERSRYQIVADGWVPRLAAAGFGGELRLGDKGRGHEWSTAWAERQCITLRGRQGREADGRG